MKMSGTWALKALALWAVLSAATMATGLVLPQPPYPGTPDGPLNPVGALLVVNAAGAMVLAGLAARLTGTTWRRLAILFAVLFSVETGLSLVEALFFNAFVKLPVPTLISMAVSGVIKAGIGATAATWLWREPGEPPAMAAIGWVRPPLLTAVYVIFYFVAGFLVAWSSEAVRVYYGDGMDIDVGRLAALQLGRGAVWTGLAVLLALSVRGRRLTVAGLVGAAFAVLMAAPLLYPSAIIPWSVRQVHLVELALVNFAFGALAVLILRRRAR